MRVALMILLGLVIGIIGTVNVMNALSQRNPMPSAVMHTMGYHMGQLNNAVKAKQCDAAQIAHHLARMQSTSSDIMPVFGISEKPFADHLAKLQRSLKQAAQAAPATCAALASVIEPINKSCKGCHQQYR